MQLLISAKCSAPRPCECLSSTTPNELGMTQAIFLPAGCPRGHTAGGQHHNKHLRRYSALHPAQAAVWSGEMPVSLGLQRCQHVLAPHHACQSYRTRISQQDSWCFQRLPDLHWPATLAWHKAHGERCRCTGDPASLAVVSLSRRHGTMGLHISLQWPPHAWPHQCPTMAFTACIQHVSRSHSDPCR